MQTIRTHGLGVLTLACLLALSSPIHAEENPVERAIAISRQVLSLSAAGKPEEGDKLLALSVEEFRTVIQTKPNEVKPWIGLGLLQTFQQKFDDAETSLREAIRLDPTNESAQAVLYKVLIDAGRLDDAIPLLVQAVQLRPKDLKLRQKYAALLMATDRLEEAEVQAQAAYQIDARDPMSIRLVSSCLVERKKFEEAVETLKAGIDVNPKDVKLREALVEVFYAVEVYSEAYAEQLELRKFEPDSTDVEQKLILLASKLRRSDLAAKHISRLRELQITQKKEEEKFGRDEFSVGNLEVKVEEHFEIKGEPGFKYTFLVFDQNGREQCRVVLFVAAEINQAHRKWGKIKDSEQVFVLAKQVGEEVGTFHTYKTLPTYDQTRALAIEMIESDDKSPKQPPAPSQPPAERSQQPGSK